MSDLIYVHIGKWHYVCLFINLFNHEIIYHSLVYESLASISANLNDIQLFHTNRGKEFDNTLIDDALEKFNLQYLLNMKGCPYNNAVAEATFKVFKPEFANHA